MELEKLEEKLDELHDMIWQIKTNQETYIAAQKEMCKSHTEKTDNVLQKVLGNGKPGLCSIVQDLQKEMHILKFIVVYVLFPIAGFFGVIFYNKLF